MNGQNGENPRLDRIEALVDRLAGQQASAHERMNALVEAQFAMIDDFKDFKRETLTYQVLAADEFRTADERLSKKIDTLGAELKASSDETNRRLKQLGEETDRRIADLVAAIGRLIARMPPPEQSAQQ